MSYCVKKLHEYQIDILYYIINNNGDCKEKTTRGGFKKPAWCGHCPLYGYCRKNNCVTPNPSTLWSVSHGVTTAGSWEDIHPVEGRVIEAKKVLRENL